MNVMGKLLKREKAERRDFPAKEKKKRKRKLETGELHRSVPEMLLMGLAVGLKIVGAISLVVAAVAVVVGGVGIWGRLRGVKKK